MGMMMQSVLAQEVGTADQKARQKQGAKKSDNAKAVSPEESQVPPKVNGVELNVSLVFFPQALIEAFTRKPGSPTEEDLIKAWRDGKGRLVASHLMFSKPEQQVSVQGKSEHVYPTQFNLIAGGVPATTTGTEEPEIEVTPPVTNTVTKAIDTGKKIEGTAGHHWAVAPENFVVRETGFVTTVEIRGIDDELKAIRVRAKLDYVVRENDHEVGTVKSGVNETSIQMLQPEFHSMGVEMERVCSDGHTAVQGGQLSSDGKEKGYFFITPRIAKVSKVVQAKENEKEIRQIETQQLLVYFPKTLVETFAKGSGSAAASSDQIIKAWRDGKGRLVSSVLSVSPSCQEIDSKGVLEDIYPSEFQVSGGSLRNGDVLWTVEPQNLVTRETGFAAQFVMNMIDDQDTIEMTFKPQYVCRGADHKIDVAWSSGGKLLQVVQPEFYRQSVELYGFVQSGQTIVAGGMLSADGEEMGYFLITPKIVKSQK